MNANGLARTYIPYVKKAVAMYGQAKQGYRVGERIYRNGIKAYNYVRSKQAVGRNRTRRVVMAPYRNAFPNSNNRGGRGSTSVYNRGGNGGGRGRSRKIKSKTRRVVRKRRKGKKKLVVSNRQGVHTCVETIQKVQDINALYVGHTNYPQATILDVVARAITKEMWTKEGLVPFTDDSLGPGVTTSYTMTYYTSPTDTALDALSSIILPSSSTFATHWVEVAILLKNLITLGDIRIKWQQFRWESTPGATAYVFKHQCNAATSYLTFDHISEFAVQNSTPNATGGVTGANTDVNNANPLTVTKYFGKGNGTEMVVRSPALVGPPVYTSFVGSPGSGQIAVLASQVVGRHLEEPPDAKVFTGTKMAKKFVLQPGAILKSTIKSTYRQSLHAYMNSFGGNPVSTQQRVTKGKFEFFGMEKVVTTTISGGPSNVKVEVDYEVDQKHKVKFSIGKENLFLPVVLPQTVLPTLV